MSVLSLMRFRINTELFQKGFPLNIPLVIDGGYGQNVASTVVECTGDEYEIIRQGIGELS